MNTIQLHDQVLGHIDQARSGRIHPLMLDSTINAVHQAMITQKIGAEWLVGSAFYYPEESTRLKESLLFFCEEHVMDNVATTINLDSFLLAGQKPLHQLLLSVDLNIGTSVSPVWITPTPVNQKDRYEISQNKFLAPQKKEWVTSYVTYSAGTLQFYLSAGLAISQVRIGYIRRPALVSHGVLKDHHDSMAAGTIVTVYSTRATYNAVTYSRGEEITLAFPALLTDGQVVTSYADVDVDPSSLGILAREVANALSAAKVGILNSRKEQ